MPTTDSADNELLIRLINNYLRYFSFVLMNDSVGVSSLKKNISNYLFLYSDANIDFKSLITLSSARFIAVNGREVFFVKQWKTSEKLNRLFNIQ